MRGFGWRGRRTDGRARTGRAVIEALEGRWFLSGDPLGGDETPHPLADEVAGDAQEPQQDISVPVEIELHAPASVRAGDSIDLTADLASPDASDEVVPSGIIVLKEGDTVLETVEVNHWGPFPFRSLWNLSPGSYTFTADYEGDGVFQPAATSVSVDVEPEWIDIDLTMPTVVSLTVQNNAEGVTLTASVGVPWGFGNITFMDGRRVLATVPLERDMATFSGRLKFGRHAIKAVYSGYDLYRPSESDIMDVVVDHIATTTTIQTTKNSLDPGESLVVAAKVRLVEKSRWRAGGWITFKEGDQTLKSVKLKNAGTVKLRLAPGSHSITAVYSGDKRHFASVSEPLTVIVKSATAMVLKSWGPATRTHPPVFTATMVRRDGTLFGAKWPDPYIAGEIKSAEAVLNGFIARPPTGVITMDGGWNTTPIGGGFSGSVPTGEVVFKDGDTVIGREELDVNGTATFRPDRLEVGWHRITAVYAGDEYFLAAKPVSTRVQITLTPTDTSLYSSTAKIAYGGSVRLAAIVSTADIDLVTPYGWVSFMEGERELARVELGRTLDVVLKLAVGTHKIRAVYLGDEDFYGSMSEVLTLKVTEAKGRG